LHFIWKNRLFDPLLFLTASGERVEVVHPGEYNNDSGPDFFNAKIRLGSTTWAGNVEVHLRSSDWLRHGHNSDRAYDNVVLQVVKNDDVRICRTNGEPVPTVEIKYETKLFDNYCKLLESDLWIPCQNMISRITTPAIELWLDRLAMERLENKADRLLKNLRLNKNDWEETCYQQIARNFGLKLNGLPFEMLAKQTPLKIISKHKDSLTQIEALFFGQAGMLDEPEGDDYYADLKREYNFLRHKFRLKPLGKHLWKFMRIRPSNFPTVRIAQFAALMQQTAGLFSRVIQSSGQGYLHELFNVTASTYWDTHYVFNRTSIRSKKKVGKVTVNLLLINTVVPLLILYGRFKDNKVYGEMALRLLKEMEAESNFVTNKWRELNFEIPDAFISQAFLQLKYEYCTPKKCLQCSIGSTLIGK